MATKSKKRVKRPSIGRVKKPPFRRWPTEGLATTDEAMEYLRLSRTTLYALMRNGKLAFSQFGDQRRIAWQELRRFERVAAAADGNLTA